MLFREPKGYGRKPFKDRSDTEFDGLLVSKHAYLVLKEPDLRAWRSANLARRLGEVGFFDKFQGERGR